MFSKSVPLSKAELPSLQEAEAQLAALKLRRQRIASIAARYVKGATSWGLERDVKSSLRVTLT